MRRMTNSTTTRWSCGTSCWNRDGARLYLCAAAGLRGEPCSAALRRRGLLRFVECQDRMGVSAAGAHLRGHPDRLHQLLLRGALSQRRLGMALAAVGALSDVRDRDRDDRSEKHTSKLQ